MFELSELANYASMLKPINTPQQEDDRISQKRTYPNDQEPSVKRSNPKKKCGNNKSLTGTSCANCGTTNTPLWRRGANGESLCNACGLYNKSKKSSRPIPSKKPAKKEIVSACEPSGTCPGDGHCDGTGGSTACSGCPAFNQRSRPSYVCANCNATTTPLWRRDEKGSTICNACGLYYKMHGSHRPVSMKRSTIKRRKRLNLSEDEISIEPSSSTPQSLAPEQPRHAKVGTIVRRSTTPKAISKLAIVPAIEDCFSANPKKQVQMKELPRVLLDVSDEPLIPLLPGRSVPSFNPKIRTQSPLLLPSQPYSSPLLNNSSDRQVFTSPQFGDRPNDELTHNSSSSGPSTFLPHSPFMPKITLPSIANLCMPPTPSFGQGLDNASLLAHREELVKEVSNIQRLLNNTNSIINGLNRLIDTPTSDSHSHSYQYAPQRHNSPSFPF